MRSTGTSSGSIGVGSAVGKEGDALSAADGPHLVDAEHGCCGKGWSGAAIRRSRLGAARRQQVIRRRPSEPARRS